jgi:hypothetical protein
MTAGDPGRRDVQVGAFILGDVPDTWSVSRQAGTAATAAACLGTAEKPCVVRVLAAHHPVAAADTGWFAALTAPCTAPSSTSVESSMVAGSVGSAKKYVVECAARGGDYANVAWVLDAGIAVLPSVDGHADDALEVFNAIRLADDATPLSPSEPSTAPSHGPAS